MAPQLAALRWAAVRVGDVGPITTGPSANTDRRSTRKRSVADSGPDTIVTSQVPLGVRGEPLHAVAGQLLSVIRRRLDEDTASLLADPQWREGGDGIDWYATRSGEVRRFSEIGRAHV